MVRNDYQNRREFVSNIKRRKGLMRRVYVSSVTCNNQLIIVAGSNVGGGGVS